MRTKKALKRLKKIDTLLADVIERFSNSDRVGALLQSAKSAIVRAKRSVNTQIVGARRKSMVKAHLSRGTANRSKKTSITKKPAAAAPRKSVAAANGRKLSKTA